MMDTLRRHFIGGRNLLHPSNNSSQNIEIVYNKFVDVLYYLPCWCITPWHTIMILHSVNTVHVLDLSCSWRPVRSERSTVSQGQTVTEINQMFKLNLSLRLDFIHSVCRSKCSIYAGSEFMVERKLCMKITSCPLAEAPPAETNEPFVPEEGLSFKYRATHISLNKYPHCSLSTDYYFTREMLLRFKEILLRLSSQSSIGEGRLGHHIITSLW